MLIPLGVLDVSADMKYELLHTKQFGSSGNDFAFATAVDSDDNIIVAGHTKGALEGTPTGYYDAYVRVYDSDWNVLWAKQFGDNMSNTTIYGMSVDSEDNIIVAGHTTNALEGTPAGYYDAYVRVYDSMGNVLWTKQFGDNAPDYAFAIDIDSDDNIIVVGSTYGVIEGVNVGLADTYVRVYDSAGGVLWTEQFGSSGNDFAFAIAVDSDDNIIVVGQTSGALEGTNVGSYDAFVRVYDSTGNILWTEQFGSNGFDNIHGISVDSDNNIIVVGLTHSIFENKDIENQDVFVRVYDSTGNILWTEQFGSNSNDYANAVTVDSDDNIIVVGTTHSTVEKTDTENQVAFVHMYDPTGNTLWTKQFDNSKNSHANAVAIDSDNNIIVVGEAQSTVEGTDRESYDAFVQMYSLVKPESTLLCKESKTTPWYD